MEEYSRQLNSEIFSEKEQISIFQMKPLLIGIESNFSEIVKNLTKNGVSQIFFYSEEENLVQRRDLYRSHYFQVKDLGKPKQKAYTEIVDQLICLQKADLVKENLKLLEIDCIVVTKIIPLSDLHILNQTANQLNIPFIFSCNLGLTFFIFSDFADHIFHNNSNNIDEDQTHTCFEEFFSRETIMEKCYTFTLFDDQYEFSGLMMMAIIEYLSEFNQISSLKIQDFVDSFQSILNYLSINSDYSLDSHKEDILTFCLTAGTEIPLINEVLGGLTATEILKCKVKRFQPINQFLFWQDFSLIKCEQIQSISQKQEVSNSLNISEKGRKEDNDDEVTDYVSVFGEKMMEKVKNLNILLVGCGAVGCEQIKNIYQMRACQGEKGHLHLVDPDKIELSNLPRQVMFQKSNVKQSKAQVCQNWLLERNPSFNVSIYQQLATQENEDTFNFDLFESLDMIIMAVDSTDARHYLADKALKHNIFLIDSATSGFSSQSQCQIPFLSDKVGIAKKKEINVSSCSTKSIIQSEGDALIFAKTLFQNEISSLRQGETAEFILENELNTFGKLYHEQSDELIQNDILLKSYVEKLFNKIFYDDVMIIGVEFNKTTFDENNSDHLDLTNSLFSILKEAFTSTPSQQNLQNGTSNQVNNQYVNLTSFDKDNQIHGTFVFKLAKIRAECFNVTFNLERYQAIGSIGNIIPAILQSTSVASGFSFLELFKYLQHKEQIENLSLQCQELYKQKPQIQKHQIVDQQEDQEEEENKESHPISGLSEEDYESSMKKIAMKFFSRFNFYQYYGKINQSDSLFRSGINFKQNDKFFPEYSINISNHSNVLEIVSQLNDYLQENGRETVYILEFEQKMIYRKDFESSALLSKWSKIDLKEYLQRSLSEIQQTLFKRKIPDSIFVLEAFSSDLNRKNQMIKGQILAKVRISIVNSISGTSDLK